jgi:hypothetical protein
MLNELCQSIGSWSSNPDHALACYLRRVWTAEHEKLLAQLKQDANAWQQWLNKVVAPEAEYRDTTWQEDKVYGWRHFWNLFNEVRGYALLKTRGYEEIEFLNPPEFKKGKVKKFADLKGNSPSSLAIMDVKTINLPNDDLEQSKRRIAPSLRVTKKMGKEMRSGDIRNPYCLATKLLQHSDPLSDFLWGQFDKPTQESLARFVNEFSRAESILVENMNRIIKGPCIYEEKRFADVRNSFQPITQDLLEGVIELPTFECLNRCLLDEAYSEEIRRWSTCVSGVEVFAPDPPMPTKLIMKSQGQINVGREQIKSTLEHMSQEQGLPTDKKIVKIVLLVVNLRHGCMFNMAKQLQATFHQTDPEVVCERGDF